MKLLTKSIYERFLQNGRIRESLAEDGRAEADFIPVVKGRRRKPPLFPFYGDIAPAFRGNVS
jgi:hypothetical protein